MHSPLEAYLEQVAAHLSALPAKRRNEELREMRQHLQNAVTVNQELGQSEEDAAANAVLQFGTAEDLGSNLVWAWKRERTRNNFSFAGAAAITALLICFGLLSMNYTDWNSILPKSLLLYLGRHPGYGMDFTRATFLLTFGLSGLAAGSLFPRQAVRGVCLGLALFWLGFAAVDGFGQLTMLMSLNGLVREERGEWMLSALVFAWTGSRARQTWNRRKRVAQA